MKTSLKATLLILLMSCSAGPVPIQYGKDNCDHCKMTIMDNKFGTEIITDKGKVLKFDSDECLRDFYKASKPAYKQILVTDYNKPATLVDGIQAFYLHSEKIKSPMGGNLAAFANKNDAENMKKKMGGEVMSWEQFIAK